MAATLTEERFSDPGVGLRAQARRHPLPGVPGRRRGAAALAQPPEPGRALPRGRRGAGGRAADLVLDGEVVAFAGAQTSFARLQQRGERDVAVFYYVFDLVHLDGNDTAALPLRARKRLLRARRAVRRPGPPHAPPQPRRRRALRGGLPQGLGGAHRQARRRALHPRALGRLAQVQVLRRAGAGDRRLHRAEGQPHRPRRAPGGPLPGRAPALRGQGRHRLHPGRPGRPRRAARAPGAGRAPRSPTRSASGAPPGCGRAWWRRWASPSGRATGACATRASWGCARTRPRRRWCASERRDRQGGPAPGGDQPRRPGRLPRGGPHEARPGPPLRDRGAGDGPPRPRQAARAAGVPPGHRGRRALPEGRPAALPRLGADRDGAQARGRDDRPGPGRRRGHAGLPRRPERGHAARLDRPRRPPGAARPPDLRPRPLGRELRRRARRGPRRRRPAARARPGAVHDDHRLARAARGGAPAAHRRLRRGPRLLAGGRAGPRRRATPRPSRSSSARPSAATGSTSTSPATPTASTPWRPTRCGPCPRRRWRPRCAGRSWTTTASTPRDGRSRRSAPASTRSATRGPGSRATPGRSARPAGPSRAARGEEAHHLRGEEVGRGVHRGVALAGQHDDP